MPFSLSLNFTDFNDELLELEIMHEVDLHLNKWSRLIKKNSNGLSLDEIFQRTREVVLRNMDMDIYDDKSHFENYVKKTALGIPYKMQGELRSSVEYVDEMSIRKLQGFDSLEDYSTYVDVELVSVLFKYSVDTIKLYEALVLGEVLNIDSFEPEFKAIILNRIRTSSKASEIILGLVEEHRDLLVDVQSRNLWLSDTKAYLKPSAKASLDYTLTLKCKDGVSILRLPLHGLEAKFSGVEWRFIYDDLPWCLLPNGSVCLEPDFVSSFREVVADVVCTFDSDLRYIGVKDGVMLFEGIDLDIFVGFVEGLE